MLVRSRVLVHSAIALGVLAVIPAHAVVRAEPPAAPTLCSKQEEVDADKKHAETGDESAVKKCVHLRIQSALIRKANVPVVQGPNGPEDPEKITPFVLKTDIGVSPKERKRMFGEGGLNENGTDYDYATAATSAAFYTCYYVARSGGALCSTATDEQAMGKTNQDEQLKEFLIKKRGGNDGQEHDDSRIDQVLVSAKTTALTAEGCARALANYGTCAQPDESEAPDTSAKPGTSDEMDDEKEYEDVSSLVHKRIAADKAEAAAVAAAKANGWLE
ncbi:hypothetical protein AB0M22_22000 [Nocardia sp. NPDC051756]|uniref:hypothetical protein n=1 Tax=Nocardia sp. NPDC051756 TaxID=3154751 RepID=UPI0034275C35